MQNKNVVTYGRGGGGSLPKRPLVSVTTGGQKKLLKGGLTLTD